MWSGRRESNPRLKLGRLRLYHWATPALAFTSTMFFGGEGWIRTIVLIRGQIYSLLPLTTRPPLRRNSALCRNNLMMSTTISSTWWDVANSSIRKNQHTNNFAVTWHCLRLHYTETFPLILQKNRFLCFWVPKKDNMPPLMWFTSARFSPFTDQILNQYDLEQTTPKKTE